MSVPHSFSPIIIRFTVRDRSSCRSKRRNALTLVTTEKDLARLRGPAGLPDWAQAIVPFAVTLECDDAAALRTFVTGVLFKARERRFNAES